MKSSEAQYRLRETKSNSPSLADVTAQGANFLLGYLSEEVPQAVNAAIDAMRKHEQMFHKTPYYFKEAQNACHDHNGGS